MKSLELINENLNIAKAIQREGLDCYEEIKELEQIKQDLEVLELIYKKNVDVKNLRIYIKTFNHDKDLLSAYNVGLDEEYRLTMEELIKLKQWVEVNENDR